MKMHLNISKIYEDATDRGPEMNPAVNQTYSNSVQFNGWKKVNLRITTIEEIKVKGLLYLSHHVSSEKRPRMLPHCQILENNSLHNFDPTSESFWKQEFLKDLFDRHVRWSFFDDH